MGNLAWGLCGRLHRQEPAMAWTTGAWGGRWGGARAGAPAAAAPPSVAVTGLGCPRAQHITGSPAGVTPATADTTGASTPLVSRRVWAASRTRRGWLHGRLGGPHAGGLGVVPNDWLGESESRRVVGSTACALLGRMRCVCGGLTGMGVSAGLASVLLVGAPHRTVSGDSVGRAHNASTTCGAADCATLMFVGSAKRMLGGAALRDGGRSLVR